jgi:hypothetical protein
LERADVLILAANAILAPREAGGKVVQPKFELDRFIDDVKSTR